MNFNGDDIVREWIQRPAWLVDGRELGEWWETYNDGRWH